MQALFQDSLISKSQRLLKNTLIFNILAISFLVLPVKNSTQLVITRVIIITFKLIIDQTLLLFTCFEEPSTIFGGFAYPKWHHNSAWIKDSEDKPNWLFKIQKEKFFTNQFIFLNK